MKEFKKYLPDYPSTRHLPHKPNTAANDSVASEVEASIIFTANDVEVTEKMDGSNCAMALIDGHPVIRNRDHILSKGYVKDTAAKKQFASVFNWFYVHQSLFEKLNHYRPVGVYGEWMIAQHGMAYDTLPAWFLAYELYDWEAGQFLEPIATRNLLWEVGFPAVPLIFTGPVASYQQLEDWANQESDFSKGKKREGIYVKIGDGRYNVGRFKMVRQGFKQGELWNPKKFNKNKIAKGVGNVRVDQGRA